MDKKVVKREQEVIVETNKFNSNDIIPIYCIGKDVDSNKLVFGCDLRVGKEYYYDQYLAKILNVEFLYWEMMKADLSEWEPMCVTGFGGEFDIICQNGVKKAFISDFGFIGECDNKYLTCLIDDFELDVTLGYPLFAYKNLPNHNFISEDSTNSILAETQVSFVLQVDQYFLGYQDNFLLDSANEFLPQRVIYEYTSEGQYQLNKKDSLLWFIEDCE